MFQENYKWNQSSVRTPYQLLPINQRSPPSFKKPESQYPQPSDFTLRSPNVNRSNNNLKVRGNHYSPRYNMDIPFNDIDRTKHLKQRPVQKNSHSMQSVPMYNQSPLRMNINSSANISQFPSRSIIDRMNENMENTLVKIDRIDHYADRLQSITERQNSILKKLKRSNLPKHLERYTQKLRLEYLKSVGEDIGQMERKMERDWEKTLKLAKKYRDELNFSDEDDDSEEGSDYEGERRSSRRRTNRKTSKRKTQARFTNMYPDPNAVSYNANVRASVSSSVEKKLPDPNALLGKVVIELKPPLPSLYPRYLKKVDIMKLNPEERKAFFRRKLKIHLWALFFPILLMNFVLKTTNKKRIEFGNAFNEMWTKIEQEALNYVVRIAEDNLRNISTERKSMVIVDGVEKGLNLKVSKGEAEAQKRFESLIKPRITLFLKILNDNSSYKDLGDTLGQFLDILFSERTYMPDKFLFDIELRRMNFNSLGGNALLSINQGKMLIGGVIFIRTILSKVVLEYPSIFKYKKDDKNFKNVMSFGGVLYYLFKKYITEMIKGKENNMNNVPMDRRVTSREPIYLNPDLQKLDANLKKNEYILGFPSEQDMVQTLEKNIDWIKESISSIDKYLNNLLENIVAQR